MTTLGTSASSIPAQRHSLSRGSIPSPPQVSENCVEMVLQSEIIDAGAADVDRPVHASGDFLSCATLFGKGDAQAFAGRRLLTLTEEIGLDVPVEHCGVDRVPFRVRRIDVCSGSGPRNGSASRQTPVGLVSRSRPRCPSRNVATRASELSWAITGGAPARDPHAKHHQRRQQHDQLLHGVRTGKQDASRWECSGISQRQRTRAAG